MRAKSPQAHRCVFGWDGKMPRNLGQIAMKPAIEADKVRYIGKELHRLAHDENLARRMQRREGRVLFHLFDECRRDALILRKRF